MCGKPLPVDPFVVVVVVVFFFRLKPCSAPFKVEGITYPPHSDVHLRFCLR